jgi:hypothetical protein
MKNSILQAMHNIPKRAFFFNSNDYAAACGLCLFR